MNTQTGPKITKRLSKDKGWTARPRTPVGTPPTQPAGPDSPAHPCSPTRCQPNARAKIWARPRSRAPARHFSDIRHRYRRSSSGPAQPRIGPTGPTTAITKTRARPRGPAQTLATATNGARGPRASSQSR